MPEYRRVGWQFFGHLVTDYRNYQVLEYETPPVFERESKDGTARKGWKLRLVHSSPYVI